jgi:hypothetical protein
VLAQEAERQAEAQRYADQMLHDAGLLRGEWGRMSFESWDVDRTPTSERALTSALAYAEEVEKGPASCGRVARALFCRTALVG